MNLKLSDASEREYIDVMKAALFDGAQVEHMVIIKFYGLSTCLHITANSGSLEATKLLLKEGAKVDVVTGIGKYTPMMLASIKNKPEIVKLLLEHNARTDLKNSDGWTALHFAAYDCNLSIAQLLVGKSNVNERDNEGKTPLGLAEGHKFNFEERNAVIEYLKQNGATM